MTQWPVIRDIALFIGGMGGVLHETLVAKAERPTLLILFAAMMGLPAFLQGPAAADENVMRGRKRRKPRADDETDD
jgi:hypothetical protein